MAKIELEGMEELIDKVNKLGKKGEEIKKNTLDKAFGEEKHGNKISKV